MAKFAIIARSFILLFMYQRGSFRLSSRYLLADRWAISPRSLERWRWAGEGPLFIKLGGRVVYRLKDVEAFETEQIRQATPNVSRSQETTDTLVLMKMGVNG